MAADELEPGPIDVVVIGFPAGAPMTGDAIPILLDLVDRGIVRVLDTAGDLTVFAGATSGLLDDDDVATAATQIEPGSAALMMVYENRWAAHFIAAVRRNGGELIAQQRVGVQQLIDALDAAEAAA